MSENTVKKYIDLFRLKNVKDGTIYEVEETNKFYIRKGHNWDEMTKAKLKEGTGPQMSLYEINQASVTQFGPMDEEKLNSYEEKMNIWCLSNASVHFMLLSKPYSYYTLFDYAANEEIHFGKTVIELLSKFNKVYSISFDEDNNAWEIWACLNKDDKAPEVFYLFPYDRGVVYYG